MWSESRRLVNKVSFSQVMCTDAYKGLVEYTSLNHERNLQEKNTQGWDRMFPNQANKIPEYFKIVHSIEQSDTQEVLQQVA